MIPGLLATEVAAALREFIVTGFETEYPPHAHQEQAWQRLADTGRAAHTLVAMGTGSGKTECFMYPVLDYCQKAGMPGIKAIVIYPMNALAMADESLILV